MFRHLPRHALNGLTLLSAALCLVVLARLLHPDGLAAGAAPDSADADADVQAEAEGGRVVARLEGPSGLAAAFSADGGEILTAGDRARVWDAGTFEPLTPPLPSDDDPPWASRGGVIAAALSRDGRLVLTRSENDCAAMVRDFSAGGGIANFPGAVRLGHTWENLHSPAVAFSPDGSRVAAGYDRVTEGGVEVYDIKTRKTVLSLTLADRFGWFLAYSPDGTKLLTLTRWRRDHTPPDVVAQVWDAATGAELSRRTIAWPAWFGPANRAPAAFSPDGSKVAAVAGDKVEVWDPTSGVLLASLPIASDGEDGAEAEAKAEAAAVAEAQGRAEAGERRRGGVFHVIRVEAGGIGPLGTLAFSTDGARLAAGANTPQARWADFPGGGGARIRREKLGAAFVWDLTTGRRLAALARRTEAVRHVAFSPDGRRLLTAGEVRRDREAVAVWDLATGRQVFAAEGLEWDRTRIRRGPAANFSPGGRRVLVGWSLDDVTTVWELPDADGEPGAGD